MIRSWRLPSGPSGLTGSRTVNVAKRGPDAYPRPSFQFRPSSREATMRGSS